MKLRNYNLILMCIVIASILLSCERQDLRIANVDNDNFCDEIANVVCYNSLRCCTSSELQSQLGITSNDDIENCINNATLKCKDSYAQVFFGIEKGTVRINNDQANNCLRSFLVNEYDCHIITSENFMEKNCKEPSYEGLQDVGQDCVFNIECRENSYCGPDRKCKAIPGEGENCGTGLYSCEEGLFCNTKQKCEARKLENEDCYGSYECAEGLFCGTGMEGEGLCLKLKTVGEECKNNGECETGFCIPGVCSNNNQSCFSTSECYTGEQGYCKETTEQACYENEDCPGKCEDSGNECYNNNYCDTDNNEECVYEDCVMPDETECVGAHVCGLNYSEIDYCSISLTLLNYSQDVY